MNIQSEFAMASSCGEFTFFTFIFVHKLWIHFFFYDYQQLDDEICPILFDEFVLI